MDDKTLLELSAKAAGEVTESWYGNEAYLDGVLGRWNPLNDDGDALRLAIAIGLKSIEFVIDEWPDHIMGVVRSQPNLAATRRAIVRAAAEIGKNMK